MRIVILGGQGNFGRRIVRALAGDAGAEIISAQRRPVPAGAVQPASITTASIDTGAAGFGAALRALRPDLVIHCAGPFQGQDYRVATETLAAGAHYVDLADGRDFLAGFVHAVDAAARTAQRTAVTGASTLPALSSAVVDALRARFARLHAIETVIAPAQRAPRGAATLAGVLSYAGLPFRSWIEGRWQTRYGWLHLDCVTLGPLGQRLAAECDVPDLELFPQRYAGVRTVRFRAALEVPLQHAGIAALALLRRSGVPVRTASFAPRLDRIASWLDAFGTQTGGMQVTLQGVNHAEHRLQIHWRVIARHNHGPEIPCFAAILLARELASGAGPPAGAFACMGLLALDDFAPEFARWTHHPLTGAARHHV